MNDATNNREPWALRNYGLTLLLAAFCCVLVAYCACTVISWDLDNNFPDLYPHRTLVQWIYVQQIQHVEKMAHDLW